MLISSVTLLPLTEMAPAVINSRAFFLDSARLVVVSMSTRLRPWETVGRKLANSSISSLEKLVKSVALSKSKLVRLSIASAFSLPWTISVAQRASVFCAIRCSGDVKCCSRMLSIADLSSKV